MCGLVGWIDFANDLRLQEPMLEAMTATMARRGPNETGTWVSTHAALGHRRLAVIDLDGGHQPALAQQPSGGDVALVFTGEIYNFREIRSELALAGRKCRDNSDTEVLVQAYLEWGSACVERLNGIFAFAIWDHDREELLLARDRMGVKPLYFHEYAGGILFTSEPKGILANPLFTPEIDEQSLVILLNSRLTQPGETPLVGLREVRPGFTLRFDRRGAFESPYWRLVSDEHSDDFDTTVATVRELIEDAVVKQLMADVPLASLLSGGLDSTVIAAIANRHMRDTGVAPLRTFSVEFESDVDHFRPTQLRPEVDGPYARRAAEYLQTQHTSLLLPTEDLIRVLPDVRRARDLPSLGQFDSSQYLMFSEISRSATVALSGEAADEVFGGYPWFYDQRLVSRDRFPWIGDGCRSFGVS